MRMIISLLGLPASGKSFYGKLLAQDKGLKFLPETATQIIYEKNYRPGLVTPLEFDKEIYKKNVERIEDAEKSDDIVVWESPPVLNTFYLEGRMRLGRIGKGAEELLRMYDSSMFKELHDKTVYLLFNISPEVSLERQKKRDKPEAMTSEIELLKFVHKKILEFCEKNKDKVIRVDVNKSEGVVLKEVEEKVSLAILNVCSTKKTEE